jgi:carbamoyltransferase
MVDHIRVVGINDYHDASVCLLEDGRIKFAIQEERLSRIKNHSGFPYRALDTALRVGGLSVEDVDIFAFNFVYRPQRRDKKGWMDWCRSSQSRSRPFVELFRRSPAFRIYEEISRKRLLNEVRKVGIAKSKVRFIDHHRAHGSTAYFGMPRNDSDEPVLVLTLDGGGDGVCSTVSIGKDGSLNRIASTAEGHSIANIWVHATFYLGMTPLEHEYKLMGLAPYPKREHFENLQKRLSELVQVDSLQFRSPLRTWTNQTLYAYPQLKQIFELERFDNICAALQLNTEETVTRWVRNCVATTGVRSVALAGGVFLNVKLNQRIMEMNEIDRLFVFPSCGDESSAIGAAFAAYADYCAETGGKTKIEPISHLYFGLEYGDDVIEEAVTKLQAERNGTLDVYKPGNMSKTIAETLSKNEIVARFDGRNEFGARALGNRSILSNATNFFNTRELNKMVKSRDFWMPFAPSILCENEEDYLVNPKKIPAPYMILSFDTTERRKEIVAAIHPYDLTARPQVVYKDHNTDYHQVLIDYREIVGPGGLLNTSFNLHGEPMVCSPEDAIQTFMNSGLRNLAIGDYMVSKKAV